MPPTETYIKELYEDRKATYSKLHDEMRECEQLRFREHNVEIPEGYKTSTQLVKTSIAEDVTLRVVSTLTTELPVINAPPASDKITDKQNASTKEHWGLGALLRMQQEAQRPVLRMGIDGACTKGMGIWKLQDREKLAWGGMRKRRRQGESAESADDYTEYTKNYRKSAPFPFHWTDVDALTYLPLRGTFGLQEVLEVTDRPVTPTAQQLGVKRVDIGNDWGWEKLKKGEAYPEGQSPTGEKKTCIEHTTKDYITYMLDGKIAEQVPNRFKLIPYYEFDALSSSSRKPEHAHQSILGPFKHLIPVLDRLLTMKTNWAYLAAWPFMVKEPTGIENMSDLPADDDSDGKDYEMVMKIPTGAILKGLKFMEPPRTGEDLNQMIEVLRMMIDRSGLASVMYGAGSSGSSGYMVSQLMTAAQLVYRPILSNAEMALERMLSDMWRIIDNVFKTEVYTLGLGETINSYSWISLGPRQINGYYTVNVKIKPVLPLDEIAKGDALQRWTGRQKLISWETGLEKFGIQAPEKEIEKVRVEGLLDDPRINDTLATDAAQEAGLIKETPPVETSPAPPMLPPQMVPPIFGPNGEMIGGGMPIVAGGAGAPVPGMGSMSGAAPYIPPGPSVPGVTQQVIPTPPPVAPSPTPPVIQTRQPGGPRRK